MAAVGTRILRQSQQQLIIRFSPWFVPTLLASFIVYVVGAGLTVFLEGDREAGFWVLAFFPLAAAYLLVMFTRRDEVVLDRSRDLLQLRHVTLLKRTTVRHQLRDLHSATLQEARGYKNTELYRAALVLDRGMDAGLHTITPRFSGFNGARHIVEVINRWHKR